MTEHPLRLTPLWRTLGALLIAFVVYASLTPDPLQIPGQQGDKLGHGLAYATMMLWFACIDSRQQVRTRWAAAFITMGIALEVVQRLTGYRTFEWNDMAADAFGVGAGWLVAPPRVPNPLRYIETWLPAAP